MGNTFGHMFRVTTWGESHGDAVGVVVDGCPPGLDLNEDDIQPDLDRRRVGQSEITSQRKEPDQAEILSGVFDGKTLGTPIMIEVRNEDARGRDYEHMRTKFRPSHADYSYQAKYGIRNWKGGGRASARETIGRVAAASIAKKVLSREAGVEVIGYVKQVWQLVADVDPSAVTLADVESNIARVPDPDMAARVIERIKQARKDGDSLGGVVEAVARGVPAGLGEPVFDKLEADLAKAMLSIPACKGFESGSGIRRRDYDRLGAQRRILRRGRPGTDAHQQLGRRPGRHIEWREHADTGCIQANGDNPAVPGDRGRRGQRDDHRG